MEAVPLIPQNLTHPPTLTPIKIDFSNAVGVLYDDNLLLPTYHSTMPIPLAMVKNIRLIKKTNYLLNILCIILCVICVVSVFFYAETILETILLSFTALLYFIISFRYRNAFYILLISKTNLEYVELIIDKALKEDAKKIMKLVQKKIRIIKKQKYN